MVISHYYKIVVVATMCTLCMTVSSFAVEYEENNPVQDVQAVAENAQVAMEDAVADATVQDLLQAPKDVSQAQEVNALDKVQEFLTKRGVTEGWNSDKKVFIAIGEASVDCEDPSYDDSFLIKRSLKAMEATLSARASVIKYIRTNMSIEDKVSTPGTDLYEQFNQKLDKLNKKIHAQKSKVMKLLTQQEQAEVEANAGVTTGDRVNALIEAAIKKLDSDFDAGKIDAQKHEKLAKIKKRYTEANQELEDLQNTMKSYEGTEKETLTSSAQLCSAMPLLGAMTVAQFEGWVESEERFEMVTVIAWSKSNEKAVRAFLKGVEYKKTPKAKSLAEWLTSQDWSSSIGGRKFQDNKGETHFIGIGAAALGTSSTSRKAGRGIAEMMARKEVATALFANVAAYERADLAQKTYNMNGKDESIALQSYASTLKQSFENRQISGLGKVYGKELIHPISGQKMYVAIFDLTSESARQAMKMEKSNYLSRIMDVVDQKRKKTTKAGYVESVKQAKKMSARSAKTSTSSSAVAPAKGQKNVYRNKSAVQGGAGSDSFDW